jgi:uncharacterized SAM-binding protein YcdF (DUF218 family)
MCHSAAWASSCYNLRAPEGSKAAGTNLSAESPQRRRTSAYNRLDRRYRWKQSFPTSYGSNLQAPPEANRRSSSAKQRRRLLAVSAVAAMLATGAWVGHDWLLLSAADLWIASDPIGPADAVAIFGGGIKDRPLAAAQYYQRGLVGKILVSNGRQSPGEKPTGVRSEVAATESILVEHGVPTSAIKTFGNDLGNTHQEVLALQAWAERNNARSLIVPTETFSARRVRWMLHRAFSDEFVIRVIALDPPPFGRDDWWRHREGIIAFRNEVIKYIWYRLVY